RPSLILLGAALATWLAFLVLTFDRVKAAFLCSLVFLGMFSYAGSERLAWEVFGAGTVRRTVLFSYPFVLLGAVLVIILWRRLRLRVATSFANWFGVVLIAVAILRSVFVGPPENFTPPSQRDLPGFVAARKGGGPDIYFIVLDAYARADTLSRLYDYDNTPFLEAMKKKGFFVPERGRSHYMNTSESFASCLNMDYLDELTPPNTTPPLADLIQDNEVFHLLKQFDYRTIALASGYEFTEFRQRADTRFVPTFLMSEAEVALLKLTPLPRIMSVLSIDLLHDQHRKRIQYQFKALVEASHMPGPQPKLVIAHICCPHRPFVFDAKGQNIQPAYPFSLTDFKRVLGKGQYAKQYVEQLQHVNTLVERTVTEILSRAARPPIIIIVSDHGPSPRHLLNVPEEELKRSDWEERVKLFALVYFPEGKSRSLSHDITLVNIWRVVFNAYFGADYPMLEYRARIPTQPGARR
ncbi:MAG: sulfatase-like hydrolase/transferase, partial [Planctomycetota bacterium]